MCKMRIRNASGIETSATHAANAIPLTSKPIKHTTTDIPANAINHACKKYFIAIL